VLVSWAENLVGRVGKGARAVLRFAFYGRVSTEDWQDPVTSRARQLQQALMLVAGVGVITAEFFDAGESRTLPWARRPQAAALVAQLADPERGWDAIVIGEYERAFYGNQYASMVPLFEHYGIQLWMPEVGGRVDWHAEDPRADHARVGAVVEAGDHPHPGPGADRDGGPDAGAGPVPGRPPAVWVSAGRCRAASEQGARSVGTAGAQAGT
jgi:hypothetical protein